MSGKCEFLERLADPFPPDIVSWRISVMNEDKSRGMAVAYIDSRDVQNRLDSVLGGDWQDEIVIQGNGLVMCRIGVQVEGWGEPRWRMDGTSALPEHDGPAKNIKEGQERTKEQKGAISDAFKRAAVKWGIGRYLYDLPSPWVAIDRYSRILPDEEKKLRVMLAKRYEEHFSRRQVENGGGGDARPQSVQSVQQVNGDVASSEGETIGDPMKNVDYVRIRRLVEGEHKSREDIDTLMRCDDISETIRDWPEAWKASMRAVYKARVSMFGDVRGSDNELESMKSKIKKCETIGDVTRVVKAPEHLDMIGRWSEGWKDELRRVCSAKMDELRRKSVQTESMIPA